MGINLLFYLFLFFLMLFSQKVFCQFDVLDKVKQKTEERIEKKTDEAIDKTLDKAEESMEGRQEESQSEKPADKPATTEQKEIVNTVKQDDLKAYSKYDFIPGDKVIFYEDFAQDNIGEFPALWWTNKAGQVKTLNKYPGKWFMMNKEGFFLLEKGMKFPENFTIEFDVIPRLTPDENFGFEFTFLAYEGEDKYPESWVPGIAGVAFYFASRGGEHTCTGYSGSDNTVTGSYSEAAGLLTPNEINRISIWVQKSRVRVYIHEEKIFDMPKAVKTGVQYNQLRFWSGRDVEPLVSNIRIAEAGADMRSKFLAEGKLTVYGINFDVNSDKIKPSSYPVLNEIAKLLKDNAGVKVKIVGHTDSDGDDKSNLELSKKRALAVKSALVKEFGVEENKMQTDGKGESQPIDKNNTSEGKAKNRRVELIKL